ncbi:hypothetical protein N7488_005283 [Penicillium malachiteum]|nr:hypothetical protein N7488_005283 [Penicillium malachiteum]
MPRQTEKLRHSPFPTNSDRLRVPKACDRCRHKKTKCDRNSPCKKCQAENANCIFGDRKTNREKTYPKGYAIFLEEQQEMLINGIRELYLHFLAGDGWPGELLHCEANGQPLVHDILSHLGVLSQDESVLATIVCQERSSTSLNSEVLQGHKLEDKGLLQQDSIFSTSNDNLNSQSLISSTAPVIDMPQNLNLLSSPPTRIDQSQIIEPRADSTLSSLSRLDVPDDENFNTSPSLPPVTMNSISPDEDIPILANHAELLFNDVQPSTGSDMLEPFTGGDLVNMDLNLFSGIDNVLDEWDMFFNLSTRSHLSTPDVVTEGHFAPFSNSSYQ